MTICRQLRLKYGGFCPGERMGGEKTEVKVGCWMLGGLPGVQMDSPDQGGTTSSR